MNASSTNVPVTKLSITVLIVLDGQPPFAINCFNFSISERNPLMTGQNASATCGYFIGPPLDLFVVNGTSAVLIEGMLQNGQKFSYWTNGTRSEPPIKTPIKPLRPISVLASAQSGPPPCTPEGFCNPAGPPTWIMVDVNASSTDVPVIQISTVVLDYDRELLVCDNFGINEKNPLMPGKNVSTTCGYRGLGAPVDLFIVNGTAAVLVEGTLQNGQTFSYWTNETTS